MTAPQMRGNVRATAANPSQSRSKDFPGTARRLLGRLAPQRRQWLAVLVLAVGGIVLSVIGPRVLGHATDLLFEGVIGRELPSGISKEQAVAAARARSSAPRTGSTPA